MKIREWKDGTFDSVVEIAQKPLPVFFYGR